MRVAQVLIVSVVVLVICSYATTGVNAGCPANCWSSNHLGTCNSHTNVCQCSAGQTGPQCAYSNNTECVEGMCSHGFNGQDGSDINLYYPMIMPPPYQDCERMRVKLISSGTDTTDMSDDSVIADFLVDLKSLAGDEVDPFCFAWTRDPYLTDSSTRFCIHITEGAKSTIDNEVYYTGRMWATITGITERFNLIEHFQYHQPPRCNEQDCNVRYNDDLSSFDWTTVNVTTHTPFVAITPVSYTAARLALIFTRPPPSGLTISWSLNCQPTATDSNSLTQVSSLEWVVFDACGLATQDSLIYFSFTCASPPCSIRVAERFAYIEEFGEDLPASVSGSQVAIFEPNVYLNTQQLAYNVTIEAIYPDAIDITASNFPFPLIASRINYCPSPALTDLSTQPQVIDGQTAIYHFPSTSFQTRRNYYFRVESPTTRCSSAQYSYTCSNVIYNVYVSRVVQANDDDDSGHQNDGKFPVVLIVLLVLFVVAVLVAVTVLIFRRYRDRLGNSNPQGYTNDFPDQLDESEVDEIVVADSTEGQNSFGISTNSAFSL